MLGGTGCFRRCWGDRVTGTPREVPWAPTSRRVLPTLTKEIQRRPVFSTFIVAFAARLAVAVLVTMLHRGVLIPDEHLYIDLARAAAAGHLGPAMWEGYGQELYRSTATFTWPLTALFWIFGPSILVGRVFAAALGACAAALTTKFALGSVRDPRWALGAGALVALLPSQVLWSSVVLRESAIWLGLVAIGVSLGSMHRRRSVLVVVGVASVCLVLLGYLRPQTAVVAAWAFGLTGLVWGGPGAARRRVLVLTTWLIAPLLAGLGVAGLTFVRQNSPDISERRAKLALGAETAIVPTTTTTTTRTVPTGTTPATTAVCATNDRDCPSETASAGGLWSDIRHAPAGFLATVARPFPWEGGQGLGLTLARAENVLWYFIYAVALVGAAVSVRRRERALLYPIVVTVAILAVSAVSQGNIGTAFRHRGQVLWALAVLVAVGLEEARERVTR